MTVIPIILHLCRIFTAVTDFLFPALKELSEDVFICPNTTLNQ